MLKIRSRFRVVASSVTSSAIPSMYLTDLFESKIGTMIMWITRSPSVLDVIFFFNLRRHGGREDFFISLSYNVICRPFKDLLTCLVPEDIGSVICFFQKDPHRHLIDKVSVEYFLIVESLGCGFE